MTGGRDTDAVSGRLLTVHATTVAVGQAALLIQGPSGSGKSALALQMMALGARLIADDQTCLTPLPDGPPRASAPEALKGMIEARGMGILAVEPAAPTRIAAVVDLGATETERLPPLRQTEVAGTSLPLFHKVESDHFPAALMQYLKGGRCLTQ